jgi:ABC-type antimicrobial peptide transport system permease subunit
MSASPGYFSAVGLDVVAGRAFGHDDLRAGRSVAIVSTGVAEALGVTPSVLVGSTLAKRAADGQGAPETIVGVVNDVRLNGPDFPASPALYLPISSRVPLSGAAHIVVRAHGAPLGLAPSIRAVVAGLDSDLPVYHIETFDGIRARLLADRRLAMIAMLVFAGLTLALSAVGVYGVTSYLVQCRTREIGIRLAIGASPSAVCRQVLLGGAGRALAGIAVGVGAAMALGRLVAARVPGFESLDVAVLVALASGLLIVALLATLLPALRAMRVDPVRTLRAE